MSGPDSSNLRNRPGVLEFLSCAFLTDVHLIEIPWTICENPVEMDDIAGITTAP